MSSQPSRDRQRGKRFIYPSETVSTLNQHTYYTIPSAFIDQVIGTTGACQVSIGIASNIFPEIHKGDHFICERMFDLARYSTPHEKRRSPFTRIVTAEPVQWEVSGSIAPGAIVQGRGPRRNVNVDAFSIMIIFVSNRL